MHGISNIFPGLPLSNSLPVHKALYRLANKLQLSGFLFSIVLMTEVQAQQLRSDQSKFRQCRVSVSSVFNRVHNASPIFHRSASASLCQFSAFSGLLLPVFRVFQNSSGCGEATGFLSQPSNTPSNTIFDLQTLCASLECDPKWHPIVFAIWNA